ncbi:Tad domain-containing protein, partial [bacterium]|nr:Tad domain-containing protein [bacterium]
MRWLRDDRGSTLVFAALVMVAVLGAAGLAIDVASVYQERRELANGADAAVLAIAEDCALGTGPCDSLSAGATARQYASANATDHLAAVDLVSLDAAGRTVTVHTSTLNSDGSTTAPQFFSRVVGWSGTNVRAGAAAVWGHPSALRSTLPLIISECEFPFGVALPTSERTIYFHDGNSADPCNAQAGQDTDGAGVLAGGFGWLTANHPCAVDLAEGAWVSDDPGASPTSSCSPEDLFALLAHPVPLPFFDDLNGVGSNGRYHIAGFGLFQVTGFNFGGQFKGPSASSAPCSGDQRCVSGYFTSGV